MAVILPPGPGVGTPPGVTTGPVAPAPGLAPHMHSGWADLRNSVNKHLVLQLARSDAGTQAAYRVLAQRGKRGHA